MSCSGPVRSFSPCSPLWTREKRAHSVGSGSSVLNVSDVKFLMLRLQPAGGRRPCTEERRTASFFVAAKAFRSGLPPGSCILKHTHTVESAVSNLPCIRGQLAELFSKWQRHQKSPVDTKGYSALRLKATWTHGLAVTGIGSRERNNPS